VQDDSILCREGDRRHAEGMGGGVRWRGYVLG
jgi:hypothetical protein